MKKIGITTFFKSLNYGALLQCIALQKCIKGFNKEYSVQVIDYQNIYDIKKFQLIRTDSCVGFIKSMLFLPLNIIRKRNFKKNMLATISLGSRKTEYDVAITGSDQVWNPMLTGGKLDDIYTLKSIKADKKISYAASVGNEECIRTIENDYRDMLNDLNFISVREESARKKLQAVCGKKIKLTVDPTALLSYDTWLDIIGHKNNRKNKKGYIFSYFLPITDRQKEMLSKICKQTSLKTTSYSSIPKERNICKYCYTDGPISFLRRLYESSLVITSSFHGTIFSIILHKNFYVLMPEQKRRSRIDNILKITGLEDRIIETEADIDKINLEDIDYTEPQKKLDKLRQESLDWLKNAIEN